MTRLPGRLQRGAGHIEELIPRKFRSMFICLDGPKCLHRRSLRSRALLDSMTKRKSRTTPQGDATSPRPLRVLGLAGVLASSMYIQTESVSLQPPAFSLLSSFSLQTVESNSM